MDSEDNTRSESNENFEQETKVSDQLSGWAVDFGITMEALSALLSILNPILNYLPKDPRTLLRTKTSYSTVKSVAENIIILELRKM